MNEEGEVYPSPSLILSANKETALCGFFIVQKGFEPVGFGIEVFAGKIGKR